MSEKKRIIAFAGRNGCGKETVAKLTVAALSAPSFTYSDVLYDVLRILGIGTPSRPQLQSLSTYVRQTLGEDILAKVMASKCAGVSGANIVIDGVRRMSDFQLLYDTFGRENVRLCWIETSAEHRYVRLKNRKEKAGETMMSWEEFQAQEVAETEVQLADIKTRADHEICNDGPLTALQGFVNEYLCELDPVAYG